MSIICFSTNTNPISTIGDLHSMIFKTFNSDIDKTTAKIGIFNKSLWAMQQDLKHGNGYAFSIFGGQSVTKKDKQAILDFNTALKNGVEPNKAWATTMTNCSIAAQNQTRQCLKAKGSLTQLANGLEITTFSAKASQVALQALSMAGNMILMWGISKVISGFYELSQVSKNVAASAKELGDSFKDTSSDIESYKNKIEELYKTINDSSSSIKDTTNARKDLLSIQDELIDKFGTEKDIINNITDAINGQSGALDNLSNKQWQELKNEFNDGGFWNALSNFFGGYSDNIERMLDEYENYHAEIHLGIDTMDLSHSDEIDTFKTLLESNFDAEFKIDYDKGGQIAILSGDVNEVYSKLLDIQNLADRFHFSDAFKNDLTKLANSAQETADKYKDFYNQYILQEKILAKDSGYAHIFKDIADAHEEYKDAFASGDENKIQEATEKYAKIVTDAASDAIANGDSDVADYFERMYPELQSVVNGWKFNIAFDGNDNDLQNRVQSVLDKLKDKNGRSLTDGEILGLDAENEQYQSLSSIADDYNMSLEEMIELLKERNLVSAMDYQGLASLFGKENIDKLSPKDLEIAYTVKNIGNMTFEQLQTEILRIKNNADPIIISDIFSLQDTENNLNTLGELNEQLDKIQSAYSTLRDTMDTYSSAGYITIDQFQEIVAQGAKFLDYLTLEDGQLSINENAMYDLAEARIIEMKAQMIQGIINNVSQIENEADASLYLASTNYELANSYNALAESELNTWKTNALANGLSQGTVDKVMRKSEKDIKKINALASSINIKSLGGSSAKSSMESAKKDWKEHLDQCLELYQAELDAGLIDFESFLSKSNTLIEEFYHDGKISAKEYYDYVKKMLETQKGIYDKVLSAVTKRFDREIDLIQDSIDAIEKQNEALEKQKDEYDTILSVVDGVYEKEIENIRSQQDAIQDTIDALQEENDERKFALQLEQAKWELYRAQTQRTKKVFNGTEFIYDTDKDAIRDAQENLADLTLEQTVDGLEKEKDALDAVIEELEYYRDIWSEISGIREKSENEQLAIALWGEDYEKLILSNRLSDIENFKDNYLSTQQQINDNQTLIDSYNEKIEYYQALKESWNSITDAYETAMNEQMAAQVLGADWESQILSGRLETLQHFRDEYIAIQQAITDATFNAANVSVEPAGNTGNTSSTSNFSDKEKVPDDSNETLKINQNEWYDPVKNRFGTGTPPKHAHNVMMKYGRGTNDAKEGHHLIAETGTEIIRDNYGNAVIAKGKQLHHFDGGETVFSPSETQELLSGDLIPLDTAPTLKRQSDVLLDQWQKIVPNFHSPISPISSMSRLPQYLDLPVSRDNSVTVSIGDIHLHEVQKVNTLARDIVLELPKKVTQELGKRRI